MILLRFDFRVKKDNLEYSMGGVVECRWPQRDEMEIEWNWVKLTNLNKYWDEKSKELLGICSLVPKNKKHAWVFEFIAYLELSGFLRWYSI